MQRFAAVVKLHTVFPHDAWGLHHIVWLFLNRLTRMEHEQPESNTTLFTALQGKTDTFLPAPQKWDAWLNLSNDKNASPGYSVHKATMAINCNWTYLICGGHLDGHWTGSEIFSRGTICVDWTHSNVCFGWTAGHADLQLCLVSGRLERCFAKPRGKNNYVKGGIGCLARFRCGYLHQVWKNRTMTLVSDCDKSSAA